MNRLILAFAAILLLTALPAATRADETYVVRKGDTLGKIARDHGTSIRELKRANGMKGSRLSIGMQLTIPVPGVPVEKAPPKRTSVPNEGPPAPGEGSRPQVHTVRKGETLRDIARAYDVSEKELRRNNRLRPGSRLKTGSQLVIRESLPAICTVAEGDTLGRIAGRYNLDVEALMELNRLESEDLTPGQELALVAPDDSTLPEGAVKLPTEAELAEIARAASASAPEEKSAESLKDRVIRVAERMLSVPYRWGGSTLRGLDCSAYVQKVFAFLDLSLPRSAREQYREGIQVDKADLSMGDLVFFRTYARYPSHVGIYLGDNRFIHASSRDRKVKIDNLEASYYVKRYIGAKRLLFEENDVQN